MQITEIRTSATLLIMIFNAASLANAQTQPTSQVVAPADKEATVANLQTVEISASASNYDPRRDDTASKIVLSREDLLKYGDPSVVDALKRVPGITIVSTGRGNDIRMRGLGSGYMQILVNGERTPAGFTLDSISPAQIERIEVYRSATAELSTESIAGTINVVLKKTAKKGQREIQFGVGADKTDRTPRGSFQLSDQNRNFSYSVSGTSRNTRFDRELPFTDEQTNGTGVRSMYHYTSSHESGRFDLFNVIPRLNWTLDNGDKLSSQNFVSFNRFQFDAYQTTTKTIGDEPKYQAMNWLIATENAQFKSDLIWSHQLEDGAKLEVKLGGQLAKADKDTRRLGYSGAQLPLNFDSLVTAHVKDRSYNSTGKYSTLIGAGHAVVFGWEMSHSVRTEDGIQRDQPFADKVAVDTVEAFDSSVKKYAVFGQDEWTITPNWSLYLGARWQGIRTSAEISELKEATTRASIWSPIVQTLYKVPQSKGSQWRFALTRTYKAPDIGDLISRRRMFEVNSATNPDRQGNPFLKPEFALGFDASYEHYSDQGAVVSMTLASRKIRDFTNSIVQLGGDGRWLATPVNDGNAQTRSIELEGKFPLQALLSAAPAVDMRASLSRNWSSVDAVPGPGNRIAQQTPLSATLAFDYTRAALVMGGSFVFANAGWARQSLLQSSYATVRRDLDLYGLWKFDAKRQLRVSFGNLLHQNGVTVSTFGDANGTRSRTAFVPSYASIRVFMEMKL